MRVFFCDHCGIDIKVTELINRRPQGWSTIRLDQALSESGKRRGVDKLNAQYELCSDCTVELRNFMVKQATA